MTGRAYPGRPVHPGHGAESERRHRPIRPELEAVLKAHGVRHDSIFLHAAARQLFACAEIEDEARWAASAKTEVCQRWWQHLDPLMPGNPGHSPVACALREVFHLDWYCGNVVALRLDAACSGIHSLTFAISRPRFAGWDCGS